MQGKRTSCSTLASTSSGWKYSNCGDSERPDKNGVNGKKRRKVLTNMVCNPKQQTEENEEVLHSKDEGQSHSGKDQRKFKWGDSQPPSGRVHKRVRKKSSNSSNINDTTRKSTSSDVETIESDWLRNMCVFCFDVIRHKLSGTSSLPPKPTFRNDKFPLFVTWKRESYGDLELRGCIGTFSAKELHNGLKEFAVSSAFQDSRFSPIEIHELNDLHCTISLLVDFETAEHSEDWHVGIHGIWIEFTDARGIKRNATYLPEIPQEQGWDKKKTIASLVRKAGYKGVLTNQIQQSIELTRYKSQKCSLSCKDYLLLKENIKRNPNSNSQLLIQV